MEHISTILQRVINDLAAGTGGTKYNPPYDSPIEDILAWRCSKYLTRDTELIKQHTVKTPFSNFRVDLVLKNSVGKIGVECDGEAYHKDITRDLIRDISIITFSDIDAIYRFKGKDIFYKEYACVWTLSKIYPELFRDNTQYLKNHYDDLELHCGNKTLVCRFKESYDNGDIVQYDNEMYVTFVSRQAIRNGVYDEVIKAIANYIPARQRS